MGAETFQRASQTVLNRLGVDATLAGEPCKAFIAHNVEIAQGDMVIARSVVTLIKTDIARSGALLVTGDEESYVLDAPLSDNGYTLRFTLRRA